MFIFFYRLLLVLSRGDEEVWCCLVRGKLVTVAFLWFRGRVEIGQEGETKLRKQD